MTYKEPTYRPVIIWGAGIRGEEADVLTFAEKWNIPIILTWGAIDLLNYDHPLNIGCFGTHGMKAANLAVQNASDVVSFGCRLDTKATGTPKDFAPHAKIYMIDIDKAEINKMHKVGRDVIGINRSCKEAIGYEAIGYTTPQISGEGWLQQCQAWKAEYVPQGEVYDLMKKIGEKTTKEDIIVSDTGNTLGWIMQGFPFKGERFIHAFNFTPMGYGLGGAIGAAFATGKRVICIIGDGGAMESLTELATIKRHNLNIKIILLNNKGHSMCKHTQRQWLNGNYYATSIEGGLGFPDFQKVADAFGVEIEEHHIDPEASLAFQVKYGEALA